MAPPMATRAGRACFATAEAVERPVLTALTAWTAVPTLVAICTALDVTEDARVAMAFRASLVFVANRIASSWAMLFRTLLLGLVGLTPIASDGPLTLSYEEKIRIANQIMR